MRKILFFMTVVLILLSSCKKSTYDENGNTILTVMIDDTVIVPESEGTIKDNRWTRYIKEEMLKKDISVEFIPKSTGLVNQVIMMATGSAPDISFTDGRLLFTKYSMEGGLYNLGPFIDEHGPKLKEETEDILPYGVLDGTQYAIPSRRGSLGRTTSLIRKDWLDILGMDIPTNRDELVTVLKAFKEQDPGGIGSENVIPWGFVPPDPGTFFEPDFILFDIMYSFMEHDLAKNMSISWPNREGVKEFLIWMRDLYSQGIIDREFATLNETENNKKLVNGQVGFIQYYTDVLFSQQKNQALYNVYKSGDDIEYVAIEVFQNSDGDYKKVQHDPIHNYLFIPKKSKVPEAAITYLNWLLEDEPRKILHYGIEGEHYNLVDGIPVIIDLDHNVKTYNYINHALRLPGEYPKDSEILNRYNSQNRDVDFNGLEDISKQINVKDGFAGPLYQESMPLWAKHGMGLIKICEKYWVKLLTEDNFEENYSEFMNKLQDRNIDLIDKEHADYYNKYN
ncbi:MAG: extracellular solute-binding protein [Spirochaetaceae bacterium]